MHYSVRHVTRFNYEVPISESVMDRAQALANVDDVEPRARRQFECDLDRGNCH